MVTGAWKIARSLVWLRIDRKLVYFVVKLEGVVTGAWKIARSLAWLRIDRKLVAWLSSFGDPAGRRLAIVSLGDFSLVCFANHRTLSACLQPVGANMAVAWDGFSGVVSSGTPCL